MIYCERTFGLPKSSFAFSLIKIGFFTILFYNYKFRMVEISLSPLPDKLTIRQSFLSYFFAILIA